METYVLVPEREFIKNETFDQKVSKLANKPFENPIEKAMALSQALNQYLFHAPKEQLEGVAVEIDDPLPYTQPPSLRRPIRQHPLQSPRQSESDIYHTAVRSSRGQQIVSFPSSVKRIRQLKKHNPAEGYPDAHRASPEIYSAHQRSSSDTRSKAKSKSNPHADQSGGQSLWR